VFVFVSAYVCRDAKSLLRPVVSGSMVLACEAMRVLCSEWRVVMAARAVLAFVFVLEVMVFCLWLPIPIQAEVRVRRLKVRRMMWWKKCILTIGLCWVGAVDDILFGKLNCFGRLYVRWGTKALVDRERWMVFEMLALY